MVNKQSQQTKYYKLEELDSIKSLKLLSVRKMPFLKVCDKLK